jgi:metal-responsive CopG/Arc/MetJ family transcriptional regulator
LAEANSSVTRFSVSVPPKLLTDYDKMVAEKGYDNRSPAIADKRG